MLNFVRGREARPATVSWNVFKTLSQTVVFWWVFLFFVPWMIVAVEQSFGFDGWGFGSSASRWFGGVLFALGGCLGLTSGMVMAAKGCGTPLPADCPRKLVVSGPYRFVRNPMAIGGLAQGVAVGAFLGSPAVVAYALAGGPVWHLFVRPWEEADLEQRFGESFRRYRNSVRCWLPRFTAYQPLNETPSMLKPPAEDLERRRPVWEAMSEFFLDTELSPSDHERIAKVLQASGHSDVELDTILWRELCPVLWYNVMPVPGEWRAFDMQRVEEKILGSPAGVFSRWQSYIVGRAVRHDWNKVRAILNAGRSCSNRSVETKP
jgi:protein-S-isoprenylcysteine O-methyltransferase Ste14